MSIEVKKDNKLEIVVEPMTVEQLRGKIFIPFDIGKIKKASLEQVSGDIKLEYISDVDTWSINVVKSEGEYDRDKKTFSKIDRIISFGLRKTESEKIEAFASEEIKSIADKLDEYFKPLKPYSVAFYSTRMVSVGEINKEAGAAEMICQLFGKEVLIEGMQKNKDMDDFQQKVLEEKYELVQTINSFHKKVGILNSKIHVGKAEINMKNGDYIDYLGGNYFNPDYWHFSIFQWSNNGPTLSFGYKLVKYPEKYSNYGGRKEYIEPEMYILTVSCHPDESFKDFNTEKGIQVIPKIDQQLNEMFKCVEI